MSTQLRTRPGLSRRGWAYLGLAVLALLGALYAFSGAVMAGSFAIADYRDAAHWRMVGRIYVILLYVLLSGFFAAVFAFVRIWRRQRAAWLSEPSG